MGRKSLKAEAGSDREEGGAKPNTQMDDAMDIDSTPAPVVDKKKAAADARAERAARRKQRREELAGQGHSNISSLASTPNPEAEPASPAKTEKKPRRTKKTDKKSNPTNEKAEAEPETEPKAPAEPAPEPAAAPEAPAPAPAPESAPEPVNDSEPLPFVIDVKPTKANVASTDISSPSASDKGTSIAPSSVYGDGVNRAARRRLMQIDRHRNQIKKGLGIPADSDERHDEVESLLAAWVAEFDEKSNVRALKKKIKKERDLGKAKSKLLRGQGNYEKQKQVKKLKQKRALRLQQEAGSGKS